MMNVLPLRKSESMMPVFKSLPIPTRVELINNHLYFMSPAPMGRHQDLVGNLFVDISVHVRRNELGKACVAPYDVYLDKHFNAVQPDLMFVSKNRMGLFEDDGFHGSPDLIIEILSRWNANHDRLKKKLLYEIFGVREYFIVDPKTSQVAAFEFVNDRFDALSTRKGVIISKILNKAFYFH